MSSTVKRSFSCAALLSALLGTFCLSFPTTALGANPAPSASAKPGTKSDDKGTAAAKDPQAPKPASDNPTSDKGDPQQQPLPAGHPPVGEELPAGHPRVEGDSHGSDRGDSRQSDPRLFQPPQDTVVDDPSLPPGTIVVTVHDAQNQPIPNAPVQLGILHNTVAKGESRQRKTRDADVMGSARFDELPVGSGTTYRVTTSRGSASYAAMPFVLSDKAGKRVAIHAYEVSSSLDGLLLYIDRSIVTVALRESNIVVEQIFFVRNASPVTWIPNDVVFDLPEGFAGFFRPESMFDTRVDEVKNRGAALRGTFKPGVHEITFRYQVPLSNDERQTLRIGLPPRVAHTRVIAEASKSLGLEASGFPSAERVQSRDGRWFLLTERGFENPADAVAITLTGLPAPGWGRWIALGLGFAAIAVAVIHLFQHRQEGASLTDDARADLNDAREALLDELVALERAHRAGDVGPKAYARLRSALLDALARIVGMLEPEIPHDKALETAGLHRSGRKSTSSARQANA